MEPSSPLLTPEHNDTTSTTTWTQFPSAPSKQLGFPPTPETRIKDLTGICIMVTLNILAVVANTAVLIVVVKAPHLRKFAFVGHLCAVDLLCAVLLMPLGIMATSPYFADMGFTVLECRFYIFINIILIAASIFTITAISVERYYYIVHPMRYEVRMTLKLTVAVLVMVWFTSIGLGLFTVFGGPDYNGLSSIGAAHCSLHWMHSNHRRVFAFIFSITCFCLPAVVIFAVYCNVYKVARVAARQHGPLPLWTNSQLKHRSDSINSQTTIITTHNTPRRTVCDWPFGRSKAAFTLVLIVGQFLICWLPYFAFHIHQLLSQMHSMPKHLEDGVTWLAYSSFSLNPFFYGLLNRQIREELCKLRRCYSGRPVELAACSHEGSGHENFLQFLHRTSCTVETHASFATPSPRSTLDQTGQTGFRIPGQIPEEFT